METRGRAVASGTAISPESAVASELFDQFVSAGTFKSVLFTYRQICDVLRLKPTTLLNFYPRLKTKLHSWKAASLWAKLDKRASHKCYNRGKACPNTRVLIIGAGPCGLRAAIEAQLLGAKVVVVEKRDRFSRNNVLHLWPFVIHDLRSLGAKKFFGKFCAGSIDHISIRQLQIILLKVALLLGVEVHENVGFESLVEPLEDQNNERFGWHACVSPSDHPVSLYEFDVLIGADGKRNTLLGFNRKEFRGKLAIAVTVNFINRHTIEEARVPEISGVAFIFNQKFFQDMRDQTAIDLENIVYYKDDTHYFVMTAKKQSLLERRVIIRDFNDTARLLAPENVDREALMEYARDAADFATNYQLPSLDFAVNHYGQADVAMFDFTSMYAAENACRIIEKKGHRLLQGLVGDSLLEPFWPTGSGCGRGFLSSFDSAWMIRSWASGKFSTLQVLAEREAIYRLLAQTTPENLSKDLNQYTLNPCSRYPNLNLQAVLPSQVRSLLETDGKVEESVMNVAVEMPKKKKRKESMIHPDTLLNWCQRQVALNDKISIQDFTSSWRNGLALCSILHRYRPDLIDVSALDPENIAKNNQLAFDICERELGIPPVMTGQEMSDCAVPDKLTMVSYISQVYESFRGEIPVISYKTHVGEERTSPSKQHHGTPLSILSRFSNRLQSKRKYSIEKEAKDRERGENIKKRSSLLAHKRKSKERGVAMDMSKQGVILTDYQSIPVNKPKDSINTRVRNLEEKLKRDAGLRCHMSEELEGSRANRLRSEQPELNIKLLQEQLQKNGRENVKKSRTPKVGKLRKDEWNAKIFEGKVKHQNLVSKSSEVEKPKVYKEIFANKVLQIDEKLRCDGILPSEETKYKNFDEKLHKLNTRLTKGNLESGEKGRNQTAAMTEHMTTIWDRKIGRRKDPLPPAPVTKQTETDSSTSTAGSEICYFCKKHVYVMERLSTQGLFFHRSCFQCEYCNTSLRLGNYSFDKDALCGGKFYCVDHFRKQKPDHRMQEIMKRKEAFLSCALEQQQKEKLYKTLLDNTEKALSPNKQTEIYTSTKCASSLPKEQKSDYLNPSDLLAKPVSPFTRDQTPERVEYENSIMEMSEEELLTSELEEEELTQKNLGLSQDLATSDDEYSDLSTDSESDEEAFAEELERSLTADETRKLAETWNRKYSAEQSLIESDLSSSRSSSSADDEESETEIGSDTSDDVDSNAEYNEENSETSDNQKDKELKMLNNVKSPDVKDSFVVEVPVIDLKSMHKVSDDDSESDISEDLTDSEDDSEDESETGTEVDSESEAKAPLSPSQIPTIVIHESPPQDIDLDQKWDAHDPSVKQEVYENLPNKYNLHRKNVYVSEGIEKPIIDCKEIIEATSKDGKNDLIEKIADDGKFSDTDKKFDSFSFRMKNEESENDISEKKVAIIGLLAKKESSLKENILSSINSLAREIVKGVIEAAKKSIVAYKQYEVESSVFKHGIINSSCSEKSSSSSGESEKSEKYDILLPVSSDDEKIHEMYKNLPNNTVLEEIPNISYSPFLVKSEKSIRNMSNIKILPCKPMEEDINKVLLVDLETQDLISDKSNLAICKTLETPKFVHNISNYSADNTFDISITEEFLDDSPLKQKFDDSFVTLRKRKKESGMTIFNWDDEDCVSLPVCYNTAMKEENFVSEDGIYHADVIQATDFESFEKCCADVVKEDSADVVKKDSADCDLTKTVNICSKMVKDVPSHKLIDNKNNITNETSEPLSCLKDISTSEPKYTILITSPNKCFDMEPEMNKCEQFNDTDKDMDENTLKKYSMSNDLKKEISKDSSPKDEVKMKGYSGSFAEKIRPKSLYCDTLYLRSLDIKLKQPFTNLNKTDDKSNKFSRSQREETVKNIFSDNNDNFDEKDDVFENEENVIDTEQQYNIKKMSSVHLKDESEYTSNNAICHSKTSYNQPSVSLSTIDSHNDLISPYTSAKVIAFDFNFPTKIRSKCDMDIHKLQQKREKRKSVHEDIQGLPFADDEKIISPVDPLGNSDIFTIVKASFDDNSKSESNVFCASAWKTPDLVDEERYLRLRNTTEQEKARQEARARARLKSDEELGLSPNNYRKKYRRQLSLNSINYDELCSDEFCDQDDELEDDIISSFNFGKNKSSGLQETFSMLKNPEIYLKGQNACTSTSSQQLQFNTRDYLRNELSLLNCNSPQTEKEIFASTDTLKFNDDPIQNVKNSALLQPSMHSNKTSSPETSPDMICSEIPLHGSKLISKAKSKASQIESSGDDDKSKSNGKKSIFSILNFGKGNVFKEKQKQKDSEKELSSSLPNDFGARSISKSNPFSHLKLSKSKEKPGKPKAKFVSSEDVPICSLDSVPALQDSLTVSLNIQQAKIIPKYTVYRDPEIMISTFPVHLPVPKMENGLAPKASEDSFSDEDDGKANKTTYIPNVEKHDKSSTEKEKKAQRIVQKVQKQQVLKRLRNAQEIQRRLEELEVEQKDLECHGVELEKIFRGKKHETDDKKEAELMQEWYCLLHTKNKLMREEQELLIRLKDLELEDRHSKLQQEMRQRLAETDLKDASQIKQEREILSEMLEIVEKRDELVAMLDQLRLREVEDENNIHSEVFLRGMKSSLSPVEKC